MSVPAGFHIAPWGEDTEQICNRSGKSLYKSAILKWSEPKEWAKNESAPIGELRGAALYIILRDHGNAKTRCMIEYVGLASNVKTRFYNHPTAIELRDKRGQTFLSFAPVDFVRGRDRIENQKKAMEEIEHILIWALGPPWNDRKNFSLPGMGVNGSNAWHIENAGFRFSGQVPLEIIFPWMLIRPGRDSSVKP